MQTTTFRKKNLFYYTTVIVQKNDPDFGYQSNDVFDPENMNSADCKAEFRVEIKADLRHLEWSASVRGVSVEWLFGDIINSFRFLDYKKNLKIGLSSVGKMYLVCALLPNFITCLYGNQTSEFFEPPTLEECFQ